ncbi:MAG: hypothetical protein Q4B09_11420 [Lachnospiraceae bacterium]|nr:hypothetical protein [Lachnospiraceae bacterium]
MGLLSTEEQNTQIKKIEKNGIIFITETETIEMKRRIDELSKAYTTKKKEIARFMLENGILEYYGDMTAEQLIQYLGRPTIRPEMDQISYCE